MTEYSVDDSRMFVMKSTASWALLTMALSKSFARRSCSVKRISLETSFEIKRKPTGSPMSSRRGVMTTRAVKIPPFFRRRLMVPSHLPERRAAARISCGLPALTSSSVCRIEELALPTTSSDS